jgi:steroid delta-isomerase-like uncharacterized protein
MTITEQHTDQNKAAVKNFIDRLFSEGDLSAVDDHLSEDFVNHDPHFGATGDRDGFRQMSNTCRTACPDWHSDMHRFVAENDVVVEHFTASGTHRGELMGIAPTGKTLVLKGINIFRFADGRIVERWGRVDELGFLRQLGVVEA